MAKYVLDTDTGVDDAMALLQILAARKKNQVHSCIQRGLFNVVFIQSKIPSCRKSFKFCAVGGASGHHNSNWKLQ